MARPQAWKFRAHIRTCPQNGIDGRVALVRHFPSFRRVRSLCGEPARIFPRHEYGVHAQFFTGPDVLYPGKLYRARIAICVRENVKLTFSSVRRSILKCARDENEVTTTTTTTTRTRKREKDDPHDKKYTYESSNMTDRLGSAPILPKTSRNDSGSGLQKGRIVSTPKISASSKYLNSFNVFKTRQPYDLGPLVNIIKRIPLFRRSPNVRRNSLSIQGRRYFNP